MKIDINKGYCVYVHITPDGKKYYGSTRQEPSKRWRYGQGYRNQHFFYDAIKRFGWDNMEHIILADNLDKESAMQMEKDLIASDKTQDPEHGYNTKNGGQSFGLHSEEFLTALNERMTGNTYCVGRKLRQSHVEALRQANIGVHRPSPFKGQHIHSEEQKKILSEISKKRWDDPEYRRKEAEHRPDFSGANNPMYGKKQSEEAKEKIRQKALGRKWDNERKEKARHKKSCRRVYQCDREGNIIKEFESLSFAAEEIGCHSESISACCRNHNKTIRGFKWRYADEDSIRCSTETRIT